MSIPERTLRTAIGALSLLGIGIAAYVTIVDFMGEVPACAAGGHGCATVAHSSYSHLFGVPVSVFGLIGYASILASALVPGDYGRVAGFGLALVGFGFSAYLTYLELDVIDAICQWCVASAIVMTVLLIVCAIRLFQISPSPQTSEGGAP